MLTTLVCSLALGTAPAPTLAPKFDISLRSLTVENPLDGQVFGDQPFGVIVIASCDPKNPKVLGTFTFGCRDGMKRNAVEDFPAGRAVAKGIEIPAKEGDYFIHVAAMERDTSFGPDVLKTFVDVHNRNLAAYSQVRLATKTGITTKLRQDFREALRQDKKLLVDDADIVQVRDFSFSRHEMDLAASPAGFEEDFQFVKLSVPTNQARYRLKFRIERSK